MINFQIKLQNLASTQRIIDSPSTLQRIFKLQRKRIRMKNKLTNQPILKISRSPIKISIAKRIL